VGKPHNNPEEGNMNTVIGKKRVNQIEVGDVVGLIGNWLNYTDRMMSDMVTVLEIALRLFGVRIAVSYYAASDYHVLALMEIIRDQLAACRKYFIFEIRR
jgi:hypothetical protein